MDSSIFSKQQAALPGNGVVTCRVVSADRFRWPTTRTDRLVDVYRQALDAKTNDMSIPPKPKPKPKPAWAGSSHPASRRRFPMRTSLPRRANVPVAP